MNKQTFFDSLDVLVSDVKGLTNITDGMDKEPHCVSVDTLTARSVHELLDDGTNYAVERMVKLDIERQLYEARLKLAQLVS